MCGFFLLLFWTTFAIINGYQFNNTNGVDYEVYLQEKLRKSIPQAFPPTDMKDKAIRVFLDIKQISEVNEKDGYLTIQMWIYCYYDSPSAQWNSSEFGGHMMIMVPRGTFWTPDISESVNFLDLVKYFPLWYHATNPPL